MILGIDGYFMCGKRTGMGVMLENILCRWNSNSFKKTILFIPSKSTNEKIELIKEMGVEIVEGPDKNFALWEQIILPHLAKKNNVDSMWFPYNTGSVLWRGKTIVTIHDLIYMHSDLKKQPSLYNFFGTIYRRSVVPIMVKKAERILMSSKTSKKELIREFEDSKEKIRVIYCSCEENNECIKYEEWEGFREKYNLGKYILAFGSNAPRKNTLRNIQAFEKVLCEQKMDYKLVLFGFKNWRESESFLYAKDKELLDKIVFLEYISEKEKNTLYANAELFLFTSTEEGFGIPILEAFKMGTNVITSNTTSMPEIAGDAALLIDPYSVENISNAVSRIITMNIKEREALKRKGKERLLFFSWNNIVLAAERAIIEC
ncbi:MAG: glycosyltransferase family 4 protein [Lachnospiraceae bacterium]|nr:glycosyltransferase family 4 protein [Lachnospiraceae bacterium]